jgi:UDP-N-acetylmuramoyl-tripeptide--D-alanyl-D-alanine ligase
MLTLNAAAKLIGAQRCGADVEFTGVTTDSRAIARGDLFVALRGERFDGHNFVSQALAQGAVAALVDKADPAWGEIPLLVVKDTRLALGQLAAQWRSRFAVALAAITGSSGKTTVKEMLHAILRAEAGNAAVLATAGNFNNDIGLPLTLLKLRAAHRYAVIEMGMNHPGEIAYLSGLAQPSVALVNNAQPAHLAGLGSVEAVAHAKGEIFHGLAADGTAVINADDPHAALWRELAGGRKLVAFGLDADADVSAAFQLKPGGSVLTVTTPHGTFAATLQAPGEHNVRNALAATAAALALGVGLETIARGLADFVPVKGRLQAKPALHGATLIDDSYNANPGSVRAAIAALAVYPGSRALVLGDMGELGADAPHLHRDIGVYAKQAGIERLLVLGELSRETAAGFGAGARHFEYIEDLLHEAENLLAPGVTVLVKGSRFMKMERVVKSLEKEAACC